MPVPFAPAATEDFHADDPLLRDLLDRLLSADERKAAEGVVARMGRLAATEVAPRAAIADRRRPVLHRFDHRGEPADHIEFHPAYREIRDLAFREGLMALPHEGGSRITQMAMGYLFGQAECGFYCPAAMTDAAAVVLDRHAPPEVAGRYVPRLTSREPEKAWEGAMFLTEKGGGSDVGGGTRTVARQVEDGSWRLSGFKWFCSNAGAEVVLTLARVDDQPGTRGLGLFVLPKFLPSGERNPGFRIERLKEKLGVTSMPTGEVTLDDAYAELVRPPGEGFHAMADMMNLCRLHNAVASAAICRRAFREAYAWARARETFGKRVVDHPLARVALVDMGMESEVALRFTFRAVEAYEKGRAGDEAEARLARLLIPIAKAGTARASVRVASEACEMLGGNGYIEDYVTPRLLRDAQVLPIWEGTTNIISLDVRRACRDDAMQAVLRAEVERLEAHAGGYFGQADAMVGTLLHEVREEANAWEATRRLYYLLGALLCREAGREGVADQVASRQFAPDVRAGERAETAFEEAVESAFS